MSVNLVTFPLAVERYNDRGVHEVKNAVCVRGQLRSSSATGNKAGRIRRFPSPGSGFIFIPT